MEFFVPLSLAIVGSAIETVELTGLGLAVTVLGLAVSHGLGLAFLGFAAITYLGLAVLLAVIIVLGLCFAFAVVQSGALFALVCSEDLSCFPDLVMGFSVDFASWDPLQS